MAACSHLSGVSGRAVRSGSSRERRHRCREGRCGEEGHMERDCPTAPAGGGGRGACFKCGEEGHIARDCPNPDTGGGGMGGRRRRGGGDGGEENMAWGKPGEGDEEELPDKEVEPEFGLSGALAAETNKVNGVVLVHQEPPEARKPTARWRLYVFKNGEQLPEPLHIHRNSCYLFGRERRVADIPTDHPSCSKQHAILQYRMTEKEGKDGMMKAAVRPYLMDLGSTNGTFLNSERLEPERYYELLETDMLKFGNSSREYVLVKETMGEPAPQRVKVYRLNEEGLWDDKGTGHVSVELLEGNTSVGLVVMGEGESPRPLLIHRITRDTTYQRQGDDTIITWTDPEIGTDIALSFQEVRGCSYIWEQVLHVQESSGSSPRIGPISGPPQSLSHVRSLGMSSAMDDFDTAGRYEEMVSGLGPHMEPGSSGSVELPEPEMASLREIARALTEVSLFQRERLAQQLAQRQGYLTRLLSVFRMCEDLEDEESLATLFTIFKHIVLLNDTGLFDLLFDEAHVMDLVGALEYEPDIKPEQRPKHREFLREQAVFKEVVPISDPKIRAKIHQTYRMGYLKDVVLPRLLDDATFATLSSLMLFNNIEVLMALYQDPDFFPAMFARLKAAAPGSSEWADLVAFLQELCGLTKHLQAQQRNSLLLRLVGLGLFEVMSAIMQRGGAEVKLKATDILLSDVQHDPSQLRAFLLTEQGNELFALLIKALLDSSDSGVQEQVLEMLKMLLDPETLEGSAEKDKFVELFYDQHISQLLAALVQAGDAPYSPGAPAPNTVGLVVDLLCYCTVSHSYRIKYYILRNNVVEKVLKLLRRKERWLVVAAIRFLRAAVQMKDEFYNRYLVKNHLLGPVVAAFLANGSRYNLLNSACLELFDFIRKENLKGLLAELVEQHWSQLEGIKYCEVFKQMHARYEQNQDRVASGNGGGGHGQQDSEAARAAHDAEMLARQRAAAAAEQRRRRGEAEVDADEESYFETAGGDSDEDEALPAGGTVVLQGGDSPGGGGLPGLLAPLVDYGDDEEEEGDTLPLRAGTPKRGSAGERPGSPPLEKRFKAGATTGGGSGSGGGGGGAALAGGAVRRCDSLGLNNNRRSWPARQSEQQLLAVIGESTSSDDSDSAAQRLLQLSQQHDTLAIGDCNFHKQLTAKERLARIEMLLQHGVTEETVQHMIERSKGGPYMQSASEGAASLAVLRERGCSDAELDILLRCQASIIGRPASNVSDVFAALDDMLQLSRPDILRVCRRRTSLLNSDGDKLRQRWSWVQAHYGLSKKAVASLAKSMVNNREVCALLTYSQDTITARVSGLQRLFELSDAEVSKLFPYLAELLEADPEQHIRPRWDLYQSLLGKFDPDDKWRFITSPCSLRLPEPTIRDVFSGVEQLMGSTAAAEDLLLRSPKSFACGIQRLATNLRTLQQLYGCSLQQAQKVLVRTPLLNAYMLEAPKFQCRVAALTEWYGHASPVSATTGAAGWQGKLGSSLWPSQGRAQAAAMTVALSQQHDTLTAGDSDCYKQLTAEERLARIEMLLQQGVTEETVQHMIERHKGGPYMQSASQGGAILAVLRESGCSDADINRLLRCQASIIGRPASNVSDVFAALDDMLQLSRPDILRRLFELSDAEVSKLIPYLAHLLEYDPEQHIRPRWDLYQSLLGEFKPADKRRFITSPHSLRLPEPTIMDVFTGVEQLMGSTAAAQSLLLRSPMSFVSGVERLATNLRALQQLYGCLLEQAQEVLVRTPKLAPLMLEAPKFQCRVAALTEWYGHASPAHHQQAQRVLLLRTSQLNTLKLEAPNFQSRHSMIVALTCAWQVSSKWGGSTQRPSGVSWRPSRPAGCGRFSNNRRSWPARQLEQQQLAVKGENASSSEDSGSAAQRLLQLSQQYDSQAAGDSHFHQQLTAEERLARIEMLLQQGVTEETVQRMIERSKGGPYMQSASEGAASLAVLRERGCSDTELNQLLSWQPNIVKRAASSVGNVFAALDDMLQLGRPKILRVCLQQSSLLTRDSDKLRQRWSWVQAHYGLSKAAEASLAKRMVNSRHVIALLSYSHHTIMGRLSGLQHVLELSDAEVSRLFPYLAELLVADPEQHIRPRWDLYQSLLGEFTPADKRRFIMSPDTLRLPEPTIRDRFSGVEQLMGSTAAAQDMLRLSPRSFAAGIKRLAINLGALQQLYGCSLQQAQRVLLHTPQLTHLMLEAPKFQSRVAALTEWYGHASPAAMLLARGRGSQLMSSIWKLGARTAFIRRLRLDRAEPELNTSRLAATTERFCRAVRVSEEEYAAFEQRWLASPEAAELCRHEGRPPYVKVIGAAGAEQVM
ncbi:Serine/threonine-protein phosphatase 4 regulatory subunit 3 [Chlorella vulgaris]